MREVRVTSLEKLEATNGEVRVLANSGDLTLVFPQLWRYPVHANGVEDLRFRSAANPFIGSFLSIGFTFLRHTKDAILINAQPSPNTERTYRNIVRLGADEVVQGRSV